MSHWGLELRKVQRDEDGLDAILGAGITPCEHQGELAQGLINCNQPNLQWRLVENKTLKVKFKSVQLVHVKRDYNQAADYVTSKTLVLGESWQVEDAEELRYLEQVSQIPEKLTKSKASPNVPSRRSPGRIRPTR
ncbi:unnamed protein product [Phytophthora fragariaefolia]|uniref:Unnamed protein product n=1 Tax=Phytophthora fragariaefolia TaxID=1490495 RepID=A0A9W6Y0Q9_9STRA|nr:unnamed protein product [Phytophthora fragariaefolia]